MTTPRTPPAERPLPRWLIRHHLVLIGGIAGLVLGLVIGAWVGSASAACFGPSQGCGVSWDAVEAIGTWVGALGGTAAVVAAVLTYWSAEKKRQDDLELAHLASATAATEELKRASKVTVSWFVSVSRAHGVKDVAANVSNRNTSHAVHEVRVRCPDLDGLVYGTQPILPGKFDRTPAIPGVPMPDGVTKQAWLAELKQNTTLTYVIDNVEWTRTGDEVPRKTGH